MRQTALAFVCARIRSMPDRVLLARSWRMPTPAEKRALVFLSAVLTLGAGVRATRALSAQPPPPSAAARAELHRQIVAVDSADSVQRISGGGKHRRSKRPKAIGISTSDGSDAAARSDSASGARRRKPTKLLLPTSGQPRDLGATPGGPIDLDRAQEWEILSLPKVGPALAHRILADRDSLGPFGSLDEGVRTLVICGRDQVEQSAPSYDDIYQQLTDERVNSRSRRYLADLRRDAVIEFR